MKKAFITGITGQDGSFLAEFLLQKGYEVHGLIRRVSHPGGLTNIEHIKDDLHLHIGSLASVDNLVAILQRVQPEELYNLSAQAHVGTSYEIPVETLDTNATGALRVFESARMVCPEARIYQASTSEMFGYAPAPQNEATPFAPTSIYSVAKIAAYYAAIHHRDAHNMFIANGLLFNHESIRRPDTFVTRKITKAAARISRGLQKELRLGNLDTGRDWGHAKDYVEAMWAILQQDTPQEFVIATGVCTSLRTFLSMAFEHFGLNWQDYVVQDERFMRPQDHHELRGDYSKAARVLGWQPKTTIKELVALMCEHDAEEVDRAVRAAA